jgi:hypothetical protein
VLNKTAWVFDWLAASAMKGLIQQTIPTIKLIPITYKKYLILAFSSTVLINKNDRAGKNRISTCSRAWIHWWGQTTYHN